MANAKIKRSTKKVPRAYSYKASHKRTTKPEDDCHHTITDAERKEEIERHCKPCARKAKFTYVKELIPN